MSTQYLGDVELITKAEVEAMLDAVVVPEATINNKIETAASTLDEAINTAKSEVHTEVETVAAALSEETTARVTLASGLNTESNARSSADTALSERISQEAAARESAIDSLRGGIIEAVNETETATFNDVISCVRISKLPIAQLTLDLHDSTVGVGDEIGTVGAKYLPAVPVTFSFVAELDNAGTPTAYYIAARLDAAGNIRVLNKTELTGAYTGNVNTVTVMYITKE